MEGDQRNTITSVGFLKQCILTFAQRKYLYSSECSLNLTRGKMSVLTAMLIVIVFAKVFKN